MKCIHCGGDAGGFEYCSEQCANDAREPQSFEEQAWSLATSLNLAVTATIASECMTCYQKLALVAKTLSQTMALGSDPAGWLEKQEAGRRLCPKCVKAANDLVKRASGKAPMIAYEAVPSSS